MFALKSIAAVKVCVYGCVFCGFLPGMWLFHFSTGAHEHKKKRKCCITNVSGTQIGPHTLLFWFLFPVRLFFPSLCLHFNHARNHARKHTPQTEWSLRHFCLWSSVDQIVPLIINVTSPPPTPHPLFLRLLLCLWLFVQNRSDILGICSAFDIIWTVSVVGLPGLMSPPSLCLLLFLFVTFSVSRDLSENQIQAIPRKAFRGITSVKNL